MPSFDRITKPFVTKKWPGTFKKVALNSTSFCILVSQKPWFLVLCLCLLEVFGESCVVGLTETGKVGKDTED